MANKYYEEMETTDNPRVYARARKGYLANSVGLIRCSFCAYHQNENASKSQKSWKRQTKRRRQYKPIQVYSSTAEQAALTRKVLRANRSRPAIK